MEFAQRTGSMIGIKAIEGREGAQKGSIPIIWHSQLSVTFSNTKCQKDRQPDSLYDTVLQMKKLMRDSRINYICMISINCRRAVQVLLRHESCVYVRIMYSTCIVHVCTLPQPQPQPRTNRPRNLKFLQDQTNPFTTNDRPIAICLTAPSRTFLHN